MVPFAGWELPVQYAGITEEHQAVRTQAGLFDVSHMGEVLVEGPAALHAVQRLVTNDVARLAVGQGLYTPMCVPSGGIVDDLTVFRTKEQSYLLIVNAATRSKDVAWIKDHAGAAEVRDVSEETALLALQGPRAAPLLSAVAGRDLAPLRPFHLIEALSIAGVRVTLSRTGYTGEDGFEIACPWDDAPIVWAVLVKMGPPHGVVPAGLGARDTLRLEAGLMLYGQDIDETTSPLEARLGWTVKFEKADFVGRAALLQQRTDGAPRRLVGIETTSGTGRGIPRHGCAINADGQRVGEVTSGTFSPTLKRPIAMGYVPAGASAPGTAIDIDVRGNPAPAQVVRLPFYRRPRT